MSRFPILAVDGGGTGCRAILMTQEGELLSLKRGSPCNYQNIGYDATRRSIADILRSCMQSSAYNTVDYAVFGLAGLDTSSDRVVLTTIIDEAMKEVGMAAHHVVLENDGLMILKGLLSTRPAILICSGTGSIVWGADTIGTTRRVGGWGHRVGDEGSGFYIGKAALVRILKSFDGRLQKSPLNNSILESLGLKSEEELISWTYSNEYSIERVASLAPIVDAMASEGETTSKSIIKAAAQELKNMITGVTGALKIQNAELDIYLCGGVLKDGSYLRQVLSDLLTDSYTKMNLHTEQLDPMINTAKYALSMVATDLSKSIGKLAKDLEQVSYYHREN